MTGCSKVAATSRMMWMDSASSASRWVSRAAALGSDIVLVPKFRDSAIQVFGEAFAELGMLERVFDRRFQITELVAAVVVLAGELPGIDALLFQQRSNRIGQLDFTSSIRRRGLEQLEYSRRQQIPAHDRQVRRRVGRVGFLDDRADGGQRSGFVADIDHAVAVGMFLRHALDDD